MFNYLFSEFFEKDPVKLGCSSHFFLFFRFDEYDVIVTSRGISVLHLVDMDKGDQDLYISAKYSIIGPLL